MKLIRLAQYLFWGSLSNSALRRYMNASREGLGDEYQRLHFHYLKKAHTARLLYERGENWRADDSELDAAQSFADSVTPSEPSTPWDGSRCKVCNIACFGELCSFHENQGEKSHAPD